MMFAGSNPPLPSGPMPSGLRIVCAIRKLAANRTKRRATAYLRGFFIVAMTSLLGVAASVENEMNRRSRKAFLGAPFMKMNLMKPDSRPPGIEQNRMCGIVSRDSDRHNDEIARVFAGIRSFQSVCNLAIQLCFVFP